MPRARRKKKEDATSGAASPPAFVPPPPIRDQKRARRADRSLVPAPPYLVASKLLDVGCDLPLLRRACPPPAAGGWRSALPVPAWGTFPRGALSHSFHLDLTEEGEWAPYRSFGDDDARAGRGGAAGVATTLSRGYDYAFRTDSTDLGDLTSPLAVSVLLGLVLLIRGVKRIFLPRFCALGRRLGAAAHGPLWADANTERIVKFGEYVYRLCYHSAISLYGLAFVYRNQIWWDLRGGGTKHLFLDYGFHPVAPGMAWYYLVQCAYNVDALVSLFLLSFEVEAVNPLTYSGALERVPLRDSADEAARKREVRRLMTEGSPRATDLLWTPLFRVRWAATVRGDFREMMAHHLVTNALILWSSRYRFTRIGSMILLIHDLSDVPIDLSKLANFVKWKVTTVVCFAVMVLLWVVMRLGVFPFVICRSVLTEHYEYLVVRGNVDPAIADMFRAPIYSLLGSLLLLHVVWFLIIMRIGWTLVTKGERHDYTEHRSGEH